MYSTLTILRDKDNIDPFPDPVVRLFVRRDPELIDHYDPIMKRLGMQVPVLAKVHDRL